MDEWLHQVATPSVVWSWMSERGCHTTCVRTASTSYSGWPGLWLLCTSLNCTSSCWPSAHCRPDDPRDPWHDEEMIQSVREIRTNVRARNPDPPFPRTAVSRRQSPVRHATQDAELIAAGFTHTYRDFFPATRGRKLPSKWVDRPESFRAGKRLKGMLRDIPGTITWRSESMRMPPIGSSTDWPCRM